MENEQSGTSEGFPPAAHKNRWKRLVIWGLIAVFAVLVISGGAFYLWFRSQVGDANADVDPAVIEALENGPAGETDGAVSGDTTAIDAPETPDGMNLVVLGADKRADDGGTPARSDTIMLVHVDPEDDFLSILSVPRDMRVDVPGHGPDKMNAAYTYGGPALVIRTVQDELGVDLDHYVEVDFEAFKEITDALGGVYVDVDRRYDDGKIQLEPGYQLLDGLNALRFVRTRHDTNIDYGRMQRQQYFISALRERATGWDLPLKLPLLIKRLFANVVTDLSPNEILKLAYWAARLGGDRLKMASIVADIGTVEGVSYVLASAKQKAAAVESFLAPPPAREEEEPPAEQTIPSPAALKTVALAGVAVDVINRTGRTGQAALAAVWLSRQGASVTSARYIKKALQGTEVAYPEGKREDGELVAQALGIDSLRAVSSVDRVTVTLGTSYGMTGEQLASLAMAPMPDSSSWSALALATDFPVAAPTYVPASCSYSYSRSYDLAVGERSAPAFRVGYRYGDEDQFLGIGATTWLDAPLAAAGEKVGPETEKDGALFTVVGTSTKTDRVWWVREGVLYWVANTLLHELSKEDLLAVAMSMVEVPEP